MGQRRKQISIVLPDASLTAKTIGDQRKYTDTMCHLPTFALCRRHNMRPASCPERRLVQGATHTIFFPLEDRVSGDPIGHGYREAGLPAPENGIWKRAARASSQQVFCAGRFAGDKDWGDPFLKMRIDQGCANLE
jgi:hypothetical protein